MCFPCVSTENIGENSSKDYGGLHCRLNGDSRHFVGGTNGLGRETTRVLAKRGARVYLAARNVAAAHEVEDILKETPNARVDLLRIDLASLESVHTAATEFLGLSVPLNVLVYVLLTAKT